MKIAICDDDEKWIADVIQILDLFAETHNNLEWETFRNGKELLSQYADDDRIYDLIITDIEMPDINGIDLAKKIRAYDKSALIIFITNYDKYIRECFSCMPLGFWDKPLKKDVVLKDLQHAYRLVQKKIICFSFTFNRRNIRIPYSEILYINSDKRNIKVHTEKDEYSFIGKLKDYKKIFEDNGFMFVHKSFCINMKYIKMKDLHSFVLCNDERIPISDAYMESVKHKYFEFLKKESGI